MAAVFKALNAKIRSNPYTNYICSTHFWGPVSNFGIPLAAIADIRKSPEIISGTMTGALILYSGTFMRYSMAVTPKNYLLFGCHFINFISQNTQMYRFLTQDQADRSAKAVAQDAKNTIEKKVDQAASKVEQKVEELKK